MTNKFYLILLTFCFPFCLKAIAQERTTTKLNRHFFEIQNKDTKNHHFNRVESVTQNGDTLIWIFDLQNRMVKQSKKGLNIEGNFNQEITETFDSANRLINQRVTNLDNSKYVIFYYTDGVKKAEVTRQGNEVYEIWRNNPDSIYSAKHNDFEAFLDKDDWNTHLMKNLRYPVEARRYGASGLVQVALLIDKEGNVKEVDIANESLVNTYLGKEAQRVAKLYKGKCIPATNIEGEPEESWITVPIRFRLG
jgi:TonB family protein